MEYISSLLAQQTTICSTGHPSLNIELTRLVRLEKSLDEKDPIPNDNTRSFR